jgi:hypothetical protein
MIHQPLFKNTDEQIAEKFRSNWQTDLVRVANVPLADDLKAVDANIIDLR